MLFYKTYTPDYNSLKPKTMKNLTRSLIFIFLFFSNVACFAKNTPYQKAFSNKGTFVNVFKAQQTQAKDHLNNKIQISMSILDLIKENTDPYKKKNEATGSWVKSTIWIKKPNWIKKELV